MCLLFSELLRIPIKFVVDIVFWFSLGLVWV